MAKRADCTLVFRAEFQDRLAAMGCYTHILPGKFVVEIRRFGEPSKLWGAMVNGDADDMITCAATAAETMRRTRRYFRWPVCDWVVGTKVDGQWRPVEDVALGVK